MKNWKQERKRLIKKYGKKKFITIENYLLDLWEHYSCRG